MWKNTCKLLLFDLDGTLLQSDKTISKRTLSVLKQCREKGILIGVSTSRSEQNSLVYLNELMKYLAVLHQKQISWNKQSKCFGNWQKQLIWCRVMKYLKWLINRAFQREHWKMQRKNWASGQRKSIIHGIGKWMQ